jgi:hypothetical protein
MTMERAELLGEPTGEAAGAGGGTSESSMRWGPLRQR